jgi:hypothetical protein
MFELNQKQPHTQQQQQRFLSKLSFFILLSLLVNNSLNVKSIESKSYFVIFVKVQFANVF